MTWVRNANAGLLSGALSDIIVFYEELARPCLPMNFASMQVAEAWAFDGILVATDLSTAAKMLRFPCAMARLFYVWDLEWVRTASRSYRDLRGVYAHPDLQLLARSNEHATLIENCWRKPIGVVEDFDLTHLAEALKRK